MTSCAVTCKKIAAIIPANISTRERCALCHRYSPVGFWVPDAVWAASVHPYYANSIMCIMCFALGADERGIPWDFDIRLFPVSLATHRSEVERATSEAP